jgi:hypothetical protein
MGTLGRLVRRRVARPAGEGSGRDPSRAIQVNSSGTHDNGASAARPRGTARRSPGETGLSRARGAAGDAPSPSTATVRRPWRASVSTSGTGGKWSTSMSRAEVSARTEPSTATPRRRARPRTGARFSSSVQRSTRIIGWTLTSLGDRAAPDAAVPTAADQAGIPPLLGSRFPPPARDLFPLTRPEAARKLGTSQPFRSQPRPRRAGPSAAISGPRPVS